MLGQCEVYFYLVMDPPEKENLVVEEGKIKYRKFKKCPNNAPAIDLWMLLNSTILHKRERWDLAVLLTISQSLDFWH